MSPQEQTLLNEQLFRLLDNDLNGSQLEQLNHLLTSDPQARLYYCRFLQDIAALTFRACADIPQNAPETAGSILTEQFWRQMIEEEKNAPAVEPAVPDAPTPQPLKTSASVRPRTPGRLAYAAAVISAAALFFILALVHLTPSPLPEVATLYDSLGAEWSANLPLEPGVRISCGSKPIRLMRGIIKLKTDEGVELVLEGPMEFQFPTDSQLSMQYGKLLARVSAQGLGFSVNTPNSKIIDLGTEFAVLCHPNGDAEVHVYKGKTNLIAGRKENQKTSQLLLAGSARKVHSKDSLVSEIRFNPSAVVRAFDSKTNLIWKGETLSLADIVGGGSGLGTGKLFTGVDAASGQVISSLKDGNIYTGSADCRPVPNNPLIDSVFVPGAGPSPTVIAVEGLTAACFPTTSGTYWGYIFNGAFHQGITSPRHDLYLDGLIAGTPENPAITIHSNLGITFDLSRIRRTIPGLEIRAFRAVAGVSETVRQSLEKEKNRSFDDFPDVKKVFDAGFSKVEFWVLIDGKPAFHQQRTSEQGGCPIHIPISESNRFLTLAVTESDDTQAYDWALFARPELVLESTEN
ncbi:MAG TPA: hypothetical protein PLV55_09110 [Anaerohalosphaeraceae bacterium]|nr:hypothetical protein [Anaerohalosphaeraceae bacterium]